jgi:hypothetical protein
VTDESIEFKRWVNHDSEDRETYQNQQEAYQLLVTEYFEKERELSLAIDWRESRSSQIQPRSFNTQYISPQQREQQQSGFSSHMGWWNDLEHFHRIQKRQKTGLNDESLDIIEAAMRDAS